MTDQTDQTDQTDTPQPTCPGCKHAAHHPGTECEAGVEHGPKRWHRCLCLNLVGADHACHPQMDCQGGTLGYSDAWHAQRRDAARTAAGRQTTGFESAVASHTTPKAASNGAARQATGQTDTKPLATSCAACSHTLNWHTPGGRCQLNSGPNGCACTAFAAPAVGQPAEARDTDRAAMNVDGPQR